MTDLINKKENSFIRTIKGFNIKNILYTLLVCLAILMSLFFGEINNSNSETENGVFGSLMSLPVTLIFFIAILSIYGLCIFIAIKNHFIKFNNKLIIFITIASIVFIYMTLVSSLTDFNHLILYHKPHGIIPTSLDRLKSSLDVFLSCIMIFALLFLFPSFKEKDLVMRIISFLFIAFTAVMIIYSLCTEIENYKQFIKFPSFFTKYDENSATYIWATSFFTYGNVYGHVLFMACLFTTYLSVSYKHRFIFLLNFIFAIFIVFSGSRTAFLAFFILIVVYAIYYLLHVYKRYKLLFYILFSLFCFVALFLILEIFLFKNITITERFIDRDTGEVKIIVYTLLDLINKVIEYMGKRIDIFIKTSQSFITTDYIFGVGYGLNDLVCRSEEFWHAFNYHNGYLEIFTAGGIFLSLFYLGFLIYLFYINIKLHKHFPKYTMYFFVSLAPYFTYQMGEAFPLMFNVFGGGMMAILYVLAPNLKLREINESCDIEYFFKNKNINKNIGGGLFKC